MNSDSLSRRERQIMRVIYRLQRATVQEVQQALPDPPTVNAVRTMIQHLEEKGWLDREKQGREFLYFPSEDRSEAGFSELQQVLETFFENSIGKALTTHFTEGKAPLTREEYEQLSALIESAKHQDESDKDSTTPDNKR